jgi:hypothetical protein
MRLARLGNYQSDTFAQPDDGGCSAVLKTDELSAKDCSLELRRGSRVRKQRQEAPRLRPAMFSFLMNSKLS